MGSFVQMGLSNALLAGLLALLALVVGRFSRRPALVHSLWVLVLVKLVTPPLVSLPVPGWHFREQAKQELSIEPPEAAVGQLARADRPAEATARFEPPAMKLVDIARDPRPQAPAAPIAQMTIDDAQPIAFVAPQPEPDPAPDSPKPAAEPFDLLTVVGWLWLAGSIVIFFANVWRIGGFQRLLRYARPAPDDLQRQTQRLAERLGLARCPEVFLIPGPVPPLLWAVGGRARLFFPSSLLPRLREPERATLIMHELAHLARRDHWVRWLELVAGCVFWWYPLLWLARSRLRAAEEECCDAWVTSELPQHRPAYAGALLETVDFLSRVPAALPPAASGFGRVHQLKRRLTMIVSGSTPGGLSLLGRLFLMVACMILPLMPARTAAPPAASADKVAEAEPKQQPTQPTSGDEPGTYQQQSQVLGGAGGDSGRVWQTAVSPDGKTLAAVSGGTGQGEGALTLYDLPEGKERVTLVHPRPIRSVAFSRDGKHLVTGDFQNNAQLRDPKTGEVKRELKGHTGGINGIVFTSDSKHLITASLDKTLKVWQVSDGKDTRTLTGHTDWVLHVAMSPDGKTLLSTSKDTTARTWDTSDYSTKHVLKGHKNWVEGGAFSPDDKTLATFGLDGTARLWDAASGKQLHEIPVTGNGLAGVFLDKGSRLAVSGHASPVSLCDVASGKVETTFDSGHTERVHALSITPDGKMLITGSWDKSVKLWDAETRAEKKKLIPKRYAVDSSFPLLAIACSPDGKLLAAAGEEKAVKLLDATSGALVHLLEGHDDVVAGVAFSTDGKTLATAGFDEKIILWDVPTGKQKETLKGHDNWVFAVAYSPDGKWLASSGYDRTVRLWDARTGKEVEKLELRHRGGVRCIAWSADSKKLASGGTDKAVRVWDFEKKELTALKGHEDAIRGVAFTADGRHVISGSEDQTVRLWNLAEEKQTASYQHNNVIRGIALSPRGKSLVVVAQDNGQRNNGIRILDPATMTLRMQSTPQQAAHNDTVTCAAYTPDARGLFTGSTDKTIRRWSATMEARSPMLTFRDGGKQMWVSSYSPDGKWLVTAGSDKAIRVRPAMLQGARPWTLAGLDSAVYGMTVSPDGKILATGCADNVVKLWDAKTGKRLGTLEGHKHRIWAIAFSPDGKKAATVAGPWQMTSELGDELGETKVWDVAGMKEIASMPPARSPVHTVAWSKDGKTLVTGSRDGSARLLDATLKVLHELKGHTDAARSACFSPGGKYVATAGFDGCVKVWTVADGKELVTLKAHDNRGDKSGANCVVWSPDGKILAASSRPGDDKTAAGEVKLWDVSYGEDGSPTFTDRAVLKGHTRNVLCCAFSPDGKTLASGGGMYGQYGEAIVWDVATNKERMQLHGHRMWLECLTFGKDGTLYTGGGTFGSRGEARAWQVNPPGWEVKDAHQGDVCCSAWSKDGKMLATGCTKGGLKVWDVPTGKMKQEMKGLKKMVRSVAFSPDGKTLASSGSDDTVRLWELDGEASISVEQAVELAKFEQNVTSVAFSPDGKWLAASTADPTAQIRTGKTKLFDVKTGKERPDGQWLNQPAMSVAFSPDGKTLATGSSGASMLRLYDVGSGKLLRAMNGANSIRAIAWSPDSKRIAATHGPGSSRGNGSIQIWDATSGQEVMALVGHTTLCLGVGYSPDGSRLASASNDGTVKVWDLVGPAISVAMGPRPVPKE